MKRRKKILILLGVLAVVCAAGVSVMQIEEKKEQIQNSDEVILEISPESVQTLSWEYGETALAFHRDEENIWHYDEDDAFPVDEEKITDLLEQFGSFGVSFIIEEVEDFSQYGLDEPECTIHLSTADQTYTVELGAFSKMDSQRYVSIGDGNAYLVATDPLEKYDAVLDDLIDHDEILAFGTVEKIAFAGEQEYVITHREEEGLSYSETDIYFIDDKPLDTAMVKSYLSDIRGLDLTDYVTYNAAEEELESFGLAAPALTVTVHHTVENQDETQTEETLVLAIGLVPEENEESGDAGDSNDSESGASGTAEEEEPAEVTAYARVGESKLVYRLSEADEAAMLAAAYDDLRHTELFTADFDQVKQMDITLEEQSYSFVAGVNEDEDSVWLWDEEEISISSVQAAIEALNADRFTEEAPQRKEEIRLIISLDNPYASQIEIVLYRYDGSSCLAEVNGEIAALVPRADAMELVEAVYGIVL